MGTNYYLIERKNICPTCGRADEKELHIGKSSAGWCFSLHVIPEEGLNNLADWEKRFFLDGITEIKNEYHELVSKKEMLSIIADRSWKEQESPYGYRDWADFHRSNYSTAGPKGLVRHAIGSHCIGHGEGTWDLVTGEFS